MDEPNLAGFRRSLDSGLIVPEAQSRKQQVWTRQELRTLNKAGKLLHSRGVQMLMLCIAHHDCKQQPLLKIKQPDGFILRCGCTDRVFQETF